MALVIQVDMQPAKTNVILQGLVLQRRYPILLPHNITERRLSSMPSFEIIRTMEVRRSVILDAVDDDDAEMLAKQIDFNDWNMLSEDEVDLDVVYVGSEGREHDD